MKNKNKMLRFEKYIIIEKLAENLKLTMQITLKYIRLIKNPIKTIQTKQHQDKLIKNYSSDTEKLIVFLTPGYDIVNGGILSISSIYEETIKLKHIHDSEVIICTRPGDPLLLKYTKFRNQNYIYRFPQILSYFKNLQNLVVHIPEYSCEKFINNCSKEEYSKMRKISHVHINIMLQNIDLLPSYNSIENLEKLGKITFTTAHEKYSTYEMKSKLGFPIHKLSTYVSPEQYDKRIYFEKKNLMIISPDDHPRKSEVLKLIIKQFPQLNVQIIKKLTYEEYKKTISQAKWALTFGEGLDGYFLETIFSGGIGFSVFNSRFFTDDFQSLKTVYPSYDLLIEKICSDIRDLDNEISYTKYQNKQYELACKYYNYKEYVNNLILFYNGQYTHI